MESTDSLLARVYKLICVACHQLIQTVSQNHTRVCMIREMRDHLLSVGFCALQRDWNLNFPILKVCS